MPTVSTPARFSDIKFIWSHGGGTVPFITKPKLAGLNQKAAQGIDVRAAEILLRYGPGVQREHAPLVQENGSRATYSFWHRFYAGRRIAAALVAKGLAENGGFTPSEMRMIDRDNAVALLPRLKG